MKKKTADSNQKSNVILSRIRRLQKSDKVSFIYNGTRRVVYTESVNFNKRQEPYLKGVEQGKGYRTYSISNISGIRTLSSNT